jgi:hypothetical protein
LTKNCRTKSIDDVSLFFRTDVSRLVFSETVAADAVVGAVIGEQRSDRRADQVTNFKLFVAVDWKMTK